jgi:hypothetical protein
MGDAVFLYLAVSRGESVERLYLLPVPYEPECSHHASPVFGCHKGDYEM